MAATKPTSRGGRRGTALTAAPADVHTPLSQARTRPTRVATSAGASPVDLPREQAKSAGGVVKVFEQQLNSHSPHRPAI
jgi:hypothetical protein